MRKKSADYSADGEQGGINRVKGLFKRRITLMLIPHSEKKVLNLQVSLFSIIAVILLFVGLLLSFFILSSGYTGSLRVVQDRDSRVNKLEADLYETSKSVNKLNESAERFKQAFNSTLSTINSGSSIHDATNSEGGDLSNLIDIKQSDASKSSLVKDIDSVTDLLETSVPKLNEIASKLNSNNEMFVDKPSIFPLRGSQGRITLKFGPKKDPFTANWYIHRGIDIGGPIPGVGVDVVATANGRVEKIDFQAKGYGSYIEIEHKYYFSTWYAHLSRVHVTKGQYVEQGEVIGVSGQTGRSKGIHLHYEVRLGPTFVDPINFIGNDYK